MLYFILPFILGTAILFSTLSHPLSMGVTLLIQTVLICILSGLFNASFWFSYILFLIFLGGMLILFIYISSLASNENFKIHLKYTALFMPLLITSLFLTLLDPMFYPSKFFNSSTFLTLENKINFGFLTPEPIYSVPSTLLTLFMISYLLLTLIVVVKIINISSSPLRPSKLNSENSLKNINFGN
uniref:NADH-ubiquinone oxidoreductase chain 6 n=1 Tax=Cherax glaber TaxID=99752 RepID=V5LX47_9EUCA|nr:NADH dehydrogenase subunit 6 [Cherax glaber]AHA59411.1 NADH dehydrogenase subunit 6 [Cherax glaber]